MNRKLATGIAVVSMLGGSAIVAGSAAADGHDNGKKAEKVSICHFAGHDGDFVITGQGRRCLRLGGNIITVNGNALKGHGLDE